MTRDDATADRVLAAAVDRVATLVDDATLVDATAGANALLVAADVDGRRSAGVAHRPAGDLPLPEAGADGLALAGCATAADPATRAVGVAALNALSAPQVDWRRGDPFASLPAGADVVTTVGSFAPAFRRFDDAAVRVIERPGVAVDADRAPDGVTVERYDPDGRAAAMAGADVAFVTGATLLYGGLGDYLAAADAAGVPSVVLVGATASFVPGPALDAGATVVAGARVTDTEAVRAAVADGACGTDLHDAGLRKVYAAAAAEPPTDRRRTEPEP
ncbi:MAG: Rossmann-like domain-containing protein [Haloferacaceae archaeon]